MKDETLVAGLKQKRAEIAGHIKSLEVDLHHVDGALRALGVSQPGLIPPAGRRRNKTLFRAGELMRLVGDAIRDGNDTPKPIAMFIMEAKGWDVGDDHLFKRVHQAVRDCRKRMRLTL